MDSKIFKKVRVVYFSGTGGTTRIANLMYKFLEKHGVAAEKEPLEHNNYLKNIYDIKNIDMIIILFPVYAFDAPEPVYKWTNKLPKGESKPVVIISVSGGGDIWPNSACREGIKKRLHKKGFNTIYERMMVMPSNFMVSTKKHLAIRLLKVLPSKTEKIVMEILKGKKQRIKPKIGGRILTVICKIEKLCARIFAKELKVRQNCNSCGWCAKNCPMDNIKMQNNIPVFKWGCIACLRCIYGCPRNAIYTKIFSFIIIKEGYNLDNIEKEICEIELESIKNINVGFLFKGVKEYLMEKK
ncbi:EFR1 family ferrodoxin [Sporosalibacterium faouarense]|uniref:EFR1 family ferrodoxin n=1 Tax=Sporosalibacterium faouarense TaxID=516123 RepID=UPI00141CA0C8|nr:EFR1 family ferrodoxin [Sporosalibacterium faouarense]MTI48931.1 hypothetical protein [Bacillota bacterium]